MLNVNEDQNDQFLQTTILTFNLKSHTCRTHFTNIKDSENSFTSACTSKGFTGVNSTPII